MSINIKNLKPSNSDSKGFTPVDADRYTVTVEAADPVKAKNNADGLNVRMVIKSGELTGKTHANKKLWVRLTAEGTAGVYLYRFLEACQSPLIDVDSITIEGIAADLIGRTLSVYAEPSSNNGQPTTNVSQYKPADFVAPATPAPVQQSATSGRIEVTAGSSASTTKSPWE